MKNAARKEAGRFRKTQQQSQTAGRSEIRS